MLLFFLRRVLAIIPTLLVVVTLAFALIHMAPGGPFDKDRELSDSAKAALEQAYHLDWPVFPLYRKADDDGRLRWVVAPPGDWGRTQYVNYLANLLRGDLGPSTRYPNVSVGQLLRQGLPPTLLVGGLALLLSLTTGLAVGLTAGWKPHSLVDHLSMALVMVGISIPSFVLAPLLVAVFSLWLGWFKVAGFSSPSQVVLPVICLAALSSAYIARLSRGAMREIMPQDFIRTARATGYNEFQVVVMHALRGALVPVVSYLGPAVAGILTGSLVIETIFNIPGIGRHFVMAALNRDYTLVMGTLIFYSVVLLVANLLVDMAYALLDPRIRYG